MKKLLSLSAILFTLISCSKDTDELGGNSHDQSIGYVAPYKNPVPDEMVGTYHHHQGELNTGTVVITKETITFKTLYYTETFIIKDYKNVYNPVCWIRLILPDGKILTIVNCIEKDNIITVQLNDDGVKYHMGVFDKEVVTEPETPQQF